jgi:hypothetical protein
LKLFIVRNCLTALTVLGLAFVAGRSAAQQPSMNQPHMQSALNALRSTHTELEQAPRDKGGYRTQAQNYVTCAINEVEAGISFANHD